MDEIVKRDFQTCETTIVGRIVGHLRGQPEGFEVSLSFICGLTGKSASQVAAAISRPLKAGIFERTHKCGEYLYRLAGGLTYETALPPRTLIIRQPDEGLKVVQRFTRAADFRFSAPPGPRSVFDVAGFSAH